MISENCITLIFILLHCFTWFLYYVSFVINVKEIYLLRRLTFKKLHIVTFYFTDSISLKGHSRLCPQYLLHCWDACDALIHKTDAGTWSFVFMIQCTWIHMLRLSVNILWNVLAFTSYSLYIILAGSHKMYRRP